MEERIKRCKKRDQHAPKSPVHTIKIAMRFLLSGALLLTTVLGTAVPRAEKKVDYTGFKLLRLSLPKTRQNFEVQLEELAAHVLNPGKKTLDVVVSPKNVDALRALVPESTIINEDVGATLAEEGELKALEFSAAAGMTNLPPTRLYTTTYASKSPARHGSRPTIPMRTISPS